ncbi:YbaB/EbfC family nucleoid-associated protein [Nocardia farcinica]|uniref:YbaB/EbfC family nucleoid-associated protein n=1 Tax=Nocardia farcinica TaxID=37329 RepID=UPI0018957AF4|nr:YbaB/EbfC family nucleoid-associated protein [Nocardia farcinica]MBF6072179.1 YbaB/EbfC family nucleoid-associated protein [Nocardia farcinica]
MKTMGVSRVAISNPDELNDLVNKTFDQIKAFEDRAHSALLHASTQSFTGTSRDKQVTATVSGDGRMVLGVRLERGFGDLSRPAWALADDIDIACAGIVEAIRDARRQAVSNSIQQLAREFPEAFELLKDLEQ